MKNTSIRSDKFINRNKFKKANFFNYFYKIQIIFSIVDYKIVVTDMTHKIKFR